MSDTLENNVLCVLRWHLAYRLKEAMIQLLSRLTPPFKRVVDKLEFIQRHVTRMLMGEDA